MGWSAAVYAAPGPPKRAGVGGFLGLWAGHVRALMGFSGLQRAHFGPFWAHFGHILGTFWTIFEPLWARFGHVLGSFWAHFWLHFGRRLHFRRLYYGLERSCSRAARKGRVGTFWPFGRTRLLLLSSGCSRIFLHLPLSRRPPKL